MLMTKPRNLEDVSAKSFGQVSCLLRYVILIYRISESFFYSVPWLPQNIQVWCGLESKKTTMMTEERGKKAKRPTWKLEQQYAN